MGEVSYRSGHLEDAVVGASGKRQLLHGLLQQVTKSGIKRTVSLQSGRGYSGIGGNSGITESLPLKLARRIYTIPHCSRTLSNLVTPYFGDGKSRGFNMKVNAVEEGAADARPISLDLRGRAPTLVLGVPKVTARTGVHGSDEHKVTWEGDLTG